MAVCPPAVQVAAVAAQLKDSWIAVGGQDCHAATSGAHTGDIAAGMLAEAGVFAVVLRHVDQLGGLSGRPEGRLLDRFGFADERDDGAIGALARVHVQQADALDALDGGGDLADHGTVSALGEIGNTLDYFLHKRGLGWCG